MKRIIAFVLCLLMIFTLASCEAGNSKDKNTEPDQVGDTSGDTSGDQNTDTDDDGSGEVSGDKTEEDEDVGTENEGGESGEQESEPNDKDDEKNEVQPPNASISQLTPLADESEVGTRHIHLKNIAKMMEFDSYEKVYTEFAVFDMDNNGKDEILIRSKNSTIVFGYFYNSGGELEGVEYGECYQFRDRIEVMTDGTFHCYEAFYSTEGLTSYISILGSETTYYVYDGEGYERSREVTKEEYDEFMSQFTCEETIDWYDLTAENVNYYIPFDVKDESYIINADFSSYDSILKVLRRLIGIRGYCKYYSLDFENYDTYFIFDSEYDYECFKKISSCIKYSFYPGSGAYDHDGVGHCALKDLNGDGSDELLIFAEWESDIVAIFSMVDGEARLVDHCIRNWERIDENGIIYVDCGGGWKVYKLNEDGDELELLDHFDIEHALNEPDSYFKMIGDDKIYISEAEYLELYRKYDISFVNREEWIEYMVCVAGFEFKNVVTGEPSKGHFQYEYDGK